MARIFSNAMPTLTIATGNRIRCLSCLFSELWVQALACVMCFSFFYNLSVVSYNLCILDKNLVRLSVGPGGRPRLWVRGRSFYAAHTMRSGIVRWRCTMGGCGCKAYTQKGTLHKLVGEHNHTGRCGRRSAKLQTKPHCPSPPTPLLVPRLPNLDFHNFDPNAWVVPLPY